MQPYTCLSNCNPPLGKVLRSIAKGRRLAKEGNSRAANPGDCVRGAWSEVMSERCRQPCLLKAAKVKLNQNPRNWLLQSARAGRQEKGTEDCSTELQESERSPGQNALPRQEERDTGKGTSRHRPKLTTRQEAHQSSHCCTEAHLKNIAGFT